MRVGELLNRAVVDTDGTAVGKVVDVRLVLDGPLDGVFARARVHGLLVGRGGAFARMGYDREDLERPWILERLFGRLHARLRFVGWDAIERVDEPTDDGVRVRLRIRADELVSGGDPR